MTNSEKVEKEFPDFANEVRGLDGAALKARIVQLQQALEESEAYKEANELLQQARAQVTELAGPYRDVKKAVKLKTKYILELLKGVGESK